MIYKRLPILPPSTYDSLVKRLSDESFIPFDPSNIDYQQFKTDVLAGAELQDADGNLMSPEEAKAFVNGLV